MNLKTFLQNPKCRFKTIPELFTERGPNYLDSFIHHTKNEVMIIFSMYNGKKFHILAINNLKNILSTDKIFTYGARNTVIDIEMLTTKSFPKHDSIGQVLKPGMIVVIENISPIKSNIPLCFKNACGTVTKVLKIINPATSYLSPFYCNTKDIDEMCIAVELINPLSSVDSYGNHVVINTKNKTLVGFEVSWHVRKANDAERKIYYNKNMHIGVDLV